jgi:glycosyltransferase involved in cell wall biosynthesis
MNEVRPGLVSVVVPVYNRPRLLREACESVFAQTYGNWELLILDDGSTDGTPAAIAALAAMHPDRVVPVRLQNGGPGAAREAGRRRCRGEFVQYLDSDDLLAPTKFEEQVRALEGAPEADIAYGITELVDDAGAVLESPHRASGERRDRLLPWLLVGRWWNTHTPLYRRAFCDRIGAWPLQRTAEDWHYDAVAARLGARLVHVPRVGSRHRVHEEDRLTGRITADGVENTAVTHGALVAAARDQGLGRDVPEVDLLARAIFLNARRADAFGRAMTADRELELAEESSPALRPRIRVYRAARALIGRRLSGRLGT